MLVDIVVSAQADNATHGGEDVSDDAEQESCEPSQNDQMNQMLLTSLLSHLNTGSVVSEFARLLAEPPIDTDSSEDESDDVEAQQELPQLADPATQQAKQDDGVQTVVEFRLVESTAGIQPSPYLASRLPHDFATSLAGHPADIGALVRLLRDGKLEHA